MAALAGLGAAATASLLSYLVRAPPGIFATETFVSERCECVHAGKCRPEAVSQTVSLSSITNLVLGG
jgi:hypothetical protein